jgi:3-oxoacyl-[acyl-carrier-protein] synthase-1
MRTPRSEPVFVAGRGAISGFGKGVPALLEALFAGQTAIAARRRTAAWSVPTEVAAEIPDGVLPAALRDGERAFEAAALAAREALAEAGEPQRGSTALVLASTKADLSGVIGDGTGLGQPWRLARRIADAFEFGGPVATVSCACASGLVAITTAARRIAAGDCERALVLGVDVQHEFVHAGIGCIAALDPGPCRPFDRRRRGVTLGEGAGALLLTRHANESLGITLAGHGGANDACHVTGPDRQGAGIALAAARALAGAGLQPRDVDVLHLHGTGTAANDATEAIGMAALFGGRTPPAFGTKAQTGHTLGAAGVLETIAAIEALRRRRAPANVGLDDPDVDAGLELVREGRQLPRALHALKVASGFGGVQAAVVLRT